jgi:1,4-dihydroxy-2-naphthoyl-CoA hydrolase
MEHEFVVSPENTLDGLIGLEIGDHGEDWAEASLPVLDRVRQPMGLVHGGVFAAIAESLTSMATARAVVPDGFVAQGLSNATNFLRPCFEGTVHARAERLHKGRTTWVWDVRMADDQGRVCAITRMVIAVRPAA